MDDPTLAGREDSAKSPIVLSRPCGFRSGIVLFRADAKKRCLLSYDRELCAGEMLQPAGYRPAQAFLRAKAVLRGVSGSIAAR